MIHAYELLLVLGIAGFYLYDSALLLYYNELVLVGRRGGWTFSWPQRHHRVRGRYPYLPNPLLPHQPVLRQSWSVESARTPATGEQELGRLTAALQPFGLWSALLLVEMVVLLPVTIFMLGTGKPFFIVLAAIYLSIASALMHLYIRRRTLGLSGRDVLALAFDGLACPPFAINLARKIALRSRIRLNPLEFARKRLDGEGYSRLTGAIASLVDEELALEDEQSARGQKLRAFRSRLEEQKR